MAVCGVAFVKRRNDLGRAVFAENVVGMVGAADIGTGEAREMAAA
jgi:hypothetical protein